MAGAESAMPPMFNRADSRKRFFFQVESFRVGPGLGGSAGVFVVIATGLSSPARLTRRELTLCDNSGKRTLVQPF